jgi:hypothetical protein
MKLYKKDQTIHLLILKFKLKFKAIPKKKKRRNISTKKKERKLHKKN